MGETLNTIIRSVTTTCLGFLFWAVNQSVISAIPNIPVEFNYLKTTKSIIDNLTMFELASLENEPLRFVNQVARNGLYLKYLGYFSYEDCARMIKFFSRYEIPLHLECNSWL